MYLTCEKKRAVYFEVLTHHLCDEKHSKKVRNPQFLWTDFEPATSRIRSKNSPLPSHIPALQGCH